VSIRVPCSPRVLILLSIGLGSCGSASNDDSADESAGGSGGGGAGGSAEGMAGTAGMAAAAGSATVCPEISPADATPCPMVGATCVYADLGCACAPTGWICQAPCPEAPPAAGMACNRPEAQICGYVGGALVTTLTAPDTTCTCKSNLFDCYTASDCPSDQPAANAACTQPGAVCSYDTQSCLCVPTLNAWLCATLS